jgi:hypothetical protein
MEFNAILVAKKGNTTMKTMQQAAPGCLALGLALAGCTTALAQGGAAAANPADIGDQTREVQIMAQVLEDSLQALWQPSADKNPAAAAVKGAPGGAALNASDGSAKALQETLGNTLSLQGPQTLGSNQKLAVDLMLPTASPFRSGRGNVEGSYLPTVGAIFNVNVDFPLSAPPAAATPTPAPEKKADANDLWEKHSSPEAAAISFDDRTNSRIIRTSDGGMRVESSSGLADPFSAGKTPAGPEYDPAKVAALRKAIVEAIAKYGWRMEHLGDDERIVVNISTNASGRRAKVVSFTSATGGGSARWTEPFAATVQPFGGDQNHLLLSFRKSDLKKELSADALGSGKVTERLYASDSERISGTSPAAVYRKMVINPGTEAKP